MNKVSTEQNTFFGSMCDPTLPKKRMPSRSVKFRRLIVSDNKMTPLASLCTWIPATNIRSVYRSVCTVCSLKVPVALTYLSKQNTPEQSTLIVGIERWQMAEICEYKSARKQHSRHQQFEVGILPDRKTIVNSP